MMMTREQYLMRDPNVPLPWVTPRLWTPPRPFRGARAIGFRSKGSARAALQINGYAEGAESELELASGLWMLTHTEILDVVSQRPQVRYRGLDGKQHVFTFDFTSLHADGTRTAHSVKPKELVEKSRIEQIHLLLQRQMSPTIANRINLITEEKLAPEDRFNAAVIYAARRFPVPAHDAVIANLVADLHGTTTIRALCRASRLRGAAFRAVVRLIAARKLRLANRARITADAVVRRGEEG
ncbi:hypothetical protein [Bradyrhizobium liaoningense]|uniref:hypothetical protein n=1 Tax=Bradyrhizobium liaoningense TaxID=43992 RepID=UPI001BABB500|nr:hypothetical protein [Bradyrhizobium liaoningense]MBR0707999.1 hypothetical protein [Bradyrhizobium liaoningense]